MTTGNDINIYPYYIHIGEPELQYARTNVLGITSAVELTPVEVNGKLYTNREKIRLYISNPNSYFVTITTDGGYSDSGYFETGDDEVKTANLSVNVKIKNITGTEIEDKTYKTTIIVDRKAPTMTNFTRTETGNIFNKTRTVSVDVTDDGSGVKKVEYRSTSLTLIGTGINLSRNSGNTWSKYLTSSQYRTGGVTATDFVGNSYTLYWGNWQK